MAGRKTQPVDGDTRQPPARRDSRPPAGRNRTRHAPDPFATWVGVAEAACPGFKKVLAQAIENLIGAGTFPQDQVGPTTILQSLQFLLTPVAFHLTLAFQQRTTAQTLERETRPGDSWHHSWPDAPPTAIYVVFHEGRSHIYCDLLPAAILDLRGRVRFWIDHSKNERLVYDRPLERKDQLPPRSEQMLRYFCEIELAGKTVSFSEVFGNVWRRDPLPSFHVIRNNLGFHQTAINAFAGGEFILTLPPRKEQDQSTIVRRRRKAVYTIGSEVHKQLCVIWKFPCP
jgi:hypothetical protein